MCIALFSTAHPDYALVLINNRDEYLSRPTAAAAWWPSPNDHILAGRDLLRPVQGTWLGITKQGRIAVLTNFREEGQVIQEAKSRGAMVNAFLMQEKTSPVDTESFAKRLIDEGVIDVGGFSLVCGQAGQPLAVISNRTPDVEDVTWIAKERDETVGLSNAAYGNHSWPKVNDGKKMMQEAIEASVKREDSKEAFVEEMMHLLSTDTLPKKKQGESWNSYVKELRNSIFIPAIGGEGTDDTSADGIATGKNDVKVQVQAQSIPKAGKDGLSGIYGTQKETVVLVNHNGSVTFVERTLFDADAQPTKASEQDRWLEFDLE
ncbi:MAG: hypothetical protein Q9183_004670 [Haloplaca sp. 2 TL-2023]